MREVVANGFFLMELMLYLAITTGLTVMVLTFALAMHQRLLGENSATKQKLQLYAIEYYLRTDLTNATIELKDWQCNEQSYNWRTNDGLVCWYLTTEGQLQCKKNSDNGNLALKNVKKFNLNLKKRFCAITKKQYIARSEVEIELLYNNKKLTHAFTVVPRNAIKIVS